jgi:hypothetical protein
MSADSGPSIAKTGLVFSFDMINTQQSFKGAPTVNLTPDLGIQAIQAAPTVTYVGVEDGWKKYSLNGTWTAGTYPYSIGVDAPTFTGGVTYSTGVYIKTNVPAKFASLFSGMNYVNVPMNNAGTSFSILQPDGSFYVGRTGFQYTSTTAQVGYLLSQPVVSQVFSSATDFVYIKSGQIEANAFPTPFVAGTRSTTSTVLDQIGNNTITATSLTYASDNTVSYNGSSNFMTATGSGLTSGMTAYTIMFWARRDAENRMPVSSATGTSFYWYGDNSWFYTHGGVTGEYYYAKPTSIPINTWGHYCVVYNGSNVSIYRQGVFQGSQATTGTANWSMGMQIGYWQGGTGYQWSGKIDTVTMYNRALTATEVQQNFNALRIRYGI